jgi:CHAD domain-containing protein
MIIPLEIRSDQSFSDSARQTAESINEELIFAANLSSSNLPESVHLIRKRLKLYRAFLKLLRDCAGSDEYKKINSRLRDLGRNFSELRDAHVRIHLLESFQTEQVFRSYEGIIKRLLEVTREQAQLIELQMRSGKDPFRHLSDSISKNKSAERFLESLDNDCAPEQGFAVAYEKAYNAYYACYLYPSAELLHEWRKRVKDLQYQCELAPWLTSSISGTLYEDIVTLAELLGEDQDVNNLLNWIFSNPELLQEDEVSAFSSILRSRRNKLKGVIHHVGKTLFRDEPDFVKGALQNAMPDGE